MRDSNLKDVLKFTLAWGAFAGILIAAQPGPFMHGMPHFVGQAEAATGNLRQNGPDRIYLVAVLENAE